MNGKNEMDSPLKAAQQELISEIESLQQEKRSLEKHLTGLKSLINLRNQLLHNKNSKIVYDEILKIITDITDAKRGSFMVVDNKSGQMGIKSSLGWQPEPVPDKAEGGGDNILEFVVNSGTDLFVKDIEEDGRFSKKNKENYETKSFLSVPIKIGQETVGIININDRNDKLPFDDYDHRVVSTAAEIASMAMENLSLAERIKMHSNEMTALFRISSSLLSTMNTKDALDTYLQIIKDSLCAEKLGIINIHENGDFDIVAGFGLTKENLNEVMKELENNIARTLAGGEVPESGTPFEIVTEETSQSIIIIPMQAMDKPIGFLVMVKKIEISEEISHDTHYLTAVANQAATLLQRDKLMAEIEKRSVDLQRSLDELKRTQNMIIQREKLASLGELISGITHEINNKLGPILGYSQLLERKAQKGSQEYKMIGHIIEATIEARKIVESFLGFSRPTSASHSQCSVNGLIDECVVVMDHLLKKSGIKLEMNLDKDIPSISADGGQIKQALLHIIRNAHQIMKDRGGQLAVTSMCRDGKIKVSISDTGPGIPEEIGMKIFEPFFSGHSGEDKGPGLGLSLAMSIVQAHQGTITYANREEGGAVFTIELPTIKEDGRK